MTEKNKNNLEKKTSIKFIQKGIRAFNAIYEISARAESRFLKVLPIYFWSSYKFYSKYKKEKKVIENFNFILDEKAFRLTERIIDNNRIREANKYQRLKELE
jgi:predicted GTPase